ncbi:MAG: TipAS antibiotic-recognition domain-containing protein [Eubacterium sp.]|nr:TipAS antibiotic-recognition domain-containing protein [Eubacterium sp.]
MKSINYEKPTQERCGDTPAYQEYKEKSKGRSADDNEIIQREMMVIFSEFAALDCSHADDSAQKLVAKLQQFITDNYYTCTDEILSGLGKMYAAEGEFKKNIDSFSGEGTADFVSQAIQIYTQ